VYPSAGQAQDFLTSSQAQWSTYANGDVDATLGYENGAGYVLGKVQRQGDLITVSMATNGGENGPDACQQALGAHDNVIVETRSCQVPAITTSHDPARGWARDPGWAVPDAERVAEAMLEKSSLDTWSSWWTPVSQQTTYEGLKTSCQRWHGDMTDIADQQ
jgi:hypothetical protein